MRNEVCQLLGEAVASLKKENVISEPEDVPIQIERSRNADHGDFASNLAMVLAKRAGLKPRELAEKICAALPKSPVIDLSLIHI